MARTKSKKSQKRVPRVPKNPRVPKKTTRRVPSSFPVPAASGSFPTVGDFCSDEESVSTSIGSRLPPVGPIDPNKVLPELLGRNAVEDRPGPLGQLPTVPRQRVIIPGDDRKPVPNTRVRPYSAICSLEINFRFGSGEIGTGWLVAPRLVITAGHCVFNKKKGGFATEILVSPGRNGSSHWQAQTVPATGGRFRTSPEYGTGSDTSPDFDYGAIILPKAFVDTGNFGFDVYDEFKLKQETFNAVGYPADKPFGTMWGHAKRLANVLSRRLEYQIDTEVGQSGSPVFDMVQENGQTFFVAVGVHNAGSQSHLINSATRINDEVHKRFQSWIKLSEAQ